MHHRPSRPVERPPSSDSADFADVPLDPPTRADSGVALMLSISSGHSASYLTGSVGVGREDYYTGAVAEGEPPGRWQGRGAPPSAWPARSTPR